MINLQTNILAIVCMFLLNILPSFLIAQNTCNPSGDLIIYSNYDGGYLNINVDENIPNLKIGVVGYESDSITISGPYANNITDIWYAGYNATNNHCSNTGPSVIVGAPVGSDSIIIYPASTLNNPNGSNNIVCNYSCDTSVNQGGCNSPDQIADYFLKNLGGSLRFHKTQYGCWGGTMNISDGGNCCIGEIITGISNNRKSELKVYPNPANDIIYIDNGEYSIKSGYTINIINVHAQRVFKSAIGQETLSINVSRLGVSGTYYIQILDPNGTIVEVKHISL